MLADTDPTVSNGTSKTYANGSKSQQRIVGTNGTHKAPVSLNGSGKQRQSQQYLGHDREEVTRILIQALSDLGYHNAADSVSQQSGFELESPSVAAFRSAVLEGAWTEAEQLLLSEHRTNERQSALVLAQGADKNVMRFWLRQQKYLELLEQRDQGRALMVLRTELTPLYQDQNKLHFLSSLLMCQSIEELKAKADWDGAYGQSRQILLSELSKCISPSVMLPEHRLAVLLHQVKDDQIGRCLYHSSASPPSLYSDHICDRRQFPSECITELDEHSGEVWHLQFSHDGRRLASCGGDKQVIIWEVPSFKVLHTLKDHEQGIGNVAWSWDDSMIVTCCQDRYARLWNANTGHLLKKLEIFSEPVSSCVWSLDDQSFITGSLDKNRSLVQWDLQGNTITDWGKSHRVEDVALSADGRWLVAMDDRNHIHVYNFITRELEYELDLKVRPFSVSISQDSRHLLVNKRDNEAQLIDLLTRSVVQQYTGHSGGDFVVRSTFGGAHETFVTSGSEDGSINIWHKSSAVLVQRLNGHSPRCNSVVWSPTDPRLFASCGDDGKIKIWSNNEWRRTHLDSLQSNAPSRNSNGWRGEQMADD